MFVCIVCTYVCVSLCMYVFVVYVHVWVFVYVCGVCMFVCVMFVSVCVYMCACWYSCVHAYGDQKLTSAISLNCLLFHYSMTKSPLHLELIDLAGLAGQQAWGWPVSSSSELGLHNTVPSFWSSCLCRPLMKGRLPDQVLLFII